MSPAGSIKDESSSRIRAFDWLRGLAVLLMIQCHALVLLKPDLRQGFCFRQLDWLDGLVAPSFLFAAGFSLALVQLRSAAAGSRGARVRKTFFRLLQVLGVACAVNFMWFPIFREPHWLLRIDILHAVGISLLCALPVIAWLAHRPRILQAVMLGCSIAVFVLAPLAEGIRGAFAPFLNISSGSLFPLLPWAGYAFLGAVVGVVAATESRTKLFLWLGGLALLLWIVWLTRDAQLAAYPPHDFWITGPANHAKRSVWVLIGATGLLWLEGRWGQRVVNSRIVGVLESFGTSSLSAYFFHLFFLYRGMGISFAGLFRDSLSWAGYLSAVALLLTMTFAASRLTDGVMGRLSFWRRARAPTAG